MPEPSVAMPGTSRRRRAVARDSAIRSAVARPRLIALSTQVWPPTPACSDRAVSPTVVTGAEKTARTSRVAEAVTPTVKAGRAAGGVARGTAIGSGGRC